MKYILYVFVIIAILALNFGVLAPLNLGWATPSIILLLVVCISMEYGNLEFLFFALLGGIWMDIYMGLPLGSFSGAYVLVGMAGYAMFQWLLLAESNWKYYLGFVIGAELFLMLWLWGYTNLLFQVDWSPIALSGRQLQRHIFQLLIAALISAVPVYVIVNMVVRQVKQWLRQPLQLS
jgi:hypothetical protein